MKKIFTLYLLLISLLVSQDAFQLMVKDAVKDSAFSTLIQTIDLDQDTEGVKDSVEDETEISFEFCSFSQEIKLSDLFFQPKLHIFQMKNTVKNIFLDKITPPPQV